MKYITGLIYIVLLFVLILGCSAKKDIFRDQGETVATQDLSADNGTKIAKDNMDQSLAPIGKSVSEITVIEEKGGCQIKLISQQKLNYTVFKLKNPDRIILDIPEVASADTLRPLAPENAFISTIKSNVLSDKDLNYLRVEIFLKKDVTYAANSDENSVIVSLQDKIADTAPLTVSRQASEAVLLKATHQKIGKGDLIQLQLQNSVPRFKSYKLQNPARLVIELENTKSEVNTGVMTIRENYIEKIRFGQKQNNLKIVLDMRESSFPPYEIKPTGNVLNVSIGEATQDPSPEKKEVAAPAANVVAKAQSEVKKQDTDKLQEKTYKGEIISLDFKDADLKNVLRLLGDISGLNMTIGDKVAGKVTLRLDNVPCDEALDIVLINNGLDKTVTPQYTRIDTVDQIKKFNDDRAQAKKSYEQAEDTILKTFSISYAQASNMANFIKQLNVLTPTRGSVNYFELTNKLTVCDIPSVISKVEKIILEQDIPTKQVMIETRVVQSAPGVIKDLGIAWGGTYAGHGGNASIPIKGAAGTNNQLVNLLGAANGAINIGYITDKYALDATLTAYESEDKLKILSNPRLLTLDNKESSIKQGVQLPYLKLNENGVTSTEFKDAVLEMKVKPKITAADTIAIQVDVKKDQKSAQTGTGNEPGIDVRQIKTDLLVESGKTVVIGGIYETTKSKNIKKVPFFSDIPFIGRWFFTSVRDEETLTEMLVFITVTIVESPKNVIIGSQQDKKG